MWHKSFFFFSYVGQASPRGLGLRGQAGTLNENLYIRETPTLKYHLRPDPSTDKRRSGFRNSLLDSIFLISGQMTNYGSCSVIISLLQTIPPLRNLSFISPTVHINYGILFLNHLSKKSLNVSRRSTSKMIKLLIFLNKGISHFYIKYINWELEFF